MPEPIVPKEVRFFFIAYNGVDKLTGKTVLGHLAFSSQGFPSLLWITEQLVPGQSKLSGNYLTDVVILSIYEFKSEEDFNDFCLGWDAMDNVNNFLQN